MINAAALSGQRWAGEHDGPLAHGAAVARLVERAKRGQLCTPLAESNAIQDLLHCVYDWPKVHATTRGRRCPADCSHPSRQVRHGGGKGALDTGHARNLPTAC